MMLKTKRAQFLVDWLNLPQATGVDDAKFEYFQLAHLQDDSPFRIEAKSRQIAWSWLAAAESVADAMLDGNDSIYVSINLGEAQEKIRYAKAVAETLYSAPISGLPKLVRDNDLALEFDNGARLNSLPARPPRGRARANVYLDEFAHVQWDNKIYTAALPVISKGGRLRIGSSPLGASGTFWEVYSEALRKYSGYSRRKTPWWEVQAFCNNVAHARLVAPNLTTGERVELFGSERLRLIHDNMPLEDFQQEYECAFSDESTALISWEEIKAAQDAELWYRTATCVENDTSPAFTIIEEVFQAWRLRKIEATFTAGLDIGRTRNTSELFLTGISTLDSYPLRMAITMDRMKYDDQKSVLFYALDRLPITQLWIDKNGIGNNLAEDAEATYLGKALGQVFTNATKTLWATDAKMLIQQGKTPLPVERELAYQLHSIKRVITASRNLVFDVDRNEKHHADKFWAWALALAAARYQHGIMSQDELDALVQWT